MGKDSYATKIEDFITICDAETGEVLLSQRGTVATPNNEENRNEE